MTLLTEDDVLTVILSLENRQGFVTSNVKKKQPSFTDIWNRLLAERIQENPKTDSYKTMTHRILKRLVAQNAVSKNGRYYELTLYGRFKLKYREVKNAKNAIELLGAGYSAYLIPPEGSELISDRSNELLLKLSEMLNEIKNEKLVFPGEKILIDYETVSGKKMIKEYS